MAKYLSVEGARHLVDKIKENFVSANEPIQAAYSTNAGYADTAGSAAKANQATNDAAGNPIHSTYLTTEDAAGIYLQQNDTAVKSTNAVTAEICTGNAENATRLATPRKINISDATELNFGTAANFDGTSDVNIKLPSKIKATIDGNSSTATRATSDAVGNVISTTYAPNFNPVFSGTPQAPTANDGTNNNQLATTAFVQTAIKNLIGTAPATLDTLHELADAINNDENFAATITEALAGKQDLNAALTSLSNIETDTDKMIFTNAPNSYVTTDLTAFIRTLLDDTDAATARQTLNALGKDETALSADSATNAAFATKAMYDSDGNIISKKYMPKITTKNLSIPTSNWIENADSDTHLNFSCELKMDSLLAGDVVNINIAPKYHSMCVGCGLCPTCEITNGKVKLFAKEIPSDEISAEYYILKGTTYDKSKSYGSVNCSTSQRIIIFQTPKQATELFFNGAVQSPTWDNYDPTKLLMTGEISGINVDTYTVTFTPIGIATWADDTQTPRSQTWKINRAVIENLPSQREPLTYNGNVQSPELINFDAEKMTLSGDFANKIDAGTYTAYATPKDNYMFSDTSISAMPFTWTIDKAEQVITFDKTSLELDNTLISDTVVVNRLGDGVIYAVSSDEKLATIKIIDNKVVVKARMTGNVSVTITVTEGTNYKAASLNLPVAIQVIQPLNEFSNPADIVEAIKSGKAVNVWDEGDLTAPITLNGTIGAALTLDNVQVRAKLIGLNHNKDFESDGKPSAHFILDMTIAGNQITLVDTNYNRASASGVAYFQHNLELPTNENGWAESNLRNKICADIFNALPEEWQNIISPCTKYTDNTGGGVDDPSFVTSTVDKIFLLSEYEVFGKQAYANTAEQNYQQQYDYFKNGNSRVHNSHKNLDSPCHWWLRSAQSSNSTSYCRVNSAGVCNTYNARYSQGITPAFMIS